MVIFRTVHWNILCGTKNGSSTLSKINGSLLASWFHEEPSTSTESFNCAKGSL